uniref:Mab-21-like HhH/H2TH-like domain-containing protein n=1 Tax=Gallus gallus TaxID=9031 RepID=A0A8V0ZCG6_CHICK
MALVLVLALLVRALIVSGSDHAVMLERVQQHEKEQRNGEQSWVDMSALLFTLLDYWKIWLCTGLFVFLFWNMWRSLKRKQHEEGGQQERQELEEQVEEVEPEEQQEQVEQEEQLERVEEVEQEDQVEHVEQEEQEEREDQGEQVQQEEQVEEVEREDEEDEYFYHSALTRYIAWRAWKKMQGKATKCVLVEELMRDLLQTYTFVYSNSFYPVLQPAIGVGSAFEGWSPCEEDIVYRLLVPIKAPHGHVFHPELGEEGDMLARNSRIRVELVCMCTREQQLGDVLCFLHHSEEELSQNQQPSLLQTLCTGSYLDVQKTAAWFNKQVPRTWRLTHRAHRYGLKVLPSSRSCKLQVTDTSSGEKVHVELLFGVQQGNLDIFLSSQNAEAVFTPSTTWPQSCAVAERKYFEYVARTAGPNSCHLVCLRLFAHILVGMGFSSYTIKTLLLHLLAIIPLEDWRRRHFLSRLENLLQYLQYCLNDKLLNHFLLGNATMPDEVVLPQAFQTASPLNLFQHLEQDPDAHSRALRDFKELKDRLFRLLLFGR